MIKNETLQIDQANSLSFTSEHLLQWDTIIVYYCLNK